MTDDQLAGLRDSTQSGSRLEESSNEEDEIQLNEFQEEFLKNLDESEGRVGSRNLSVNDPMLWSVMAALDEYDDRHETLRDKAGVSRESRSALLSQLLRVGLSEVYPELSGEVAEAIKSQSDDPFSR